MGLYLGSTKIPTISFYKQSGIIPSGIFTIPSTSGTYDVTSYAFAQGDFGYGRLPEVISGDLSYYENLSASQIAPYAFAGMSIEVNMPNITSIGASAFYMNRNSTFSFSQCKTIGAYAFYGCSNLTTVSFPLCESIGSSAFASCNNITSISFPECTNVDQYAFNSCAKLTSINFPVLSSLAGYMAFYGCTSLTSISLPILENLNGGYAFYYCTNLSEVYLPECKSIGGYNAFYYCPKLTSVNLPKCTYLSQGVFSYCNSLATVNLPLVETINTQDFCGCSKISLLSFSKCSFIGNSAFQSCYNLLSFYLMNSVVCSLNNITAFSSTPISNYTASTGGVYGSIFVPASLLASYKSATNWAAYSDRMVGI